MSRRALATSVAGIAVITLVILLFTLPVPYAVLSPGPVCNTLGAGTRECPSTGQGNGPLITVSPASADHPVSGAKLGATTVSQLRGEPTLATALDSWLSASDAVIPREVIIPPDQSSADVQREGRAQMQQAQSSAVDAAEAALGLLDVKVAGVQAGSPAAAALRTGDLVTALNGTPIRSAGQLQALSAAVTDVNARFTFTVRRGGVPMQVQVGRVRGGQDETPRFGISLANEARGVKVNVTLDPNAVGGPSAGLMLALGVYDRLTPGSLTGTTVVAGTGTIDDAGNVGEIGGIQQKMYAARHAFKASVFLAPAGDCDEARGSIPKGLNVVRVSTLDDALRALSAVRDGHADSLPHC